MALGRPSFDTPRVLGIGASAGGPSTVLRVLRELKAPFPLPIVVVQHSFPAFTSTLATWLGRESGLPTRVAADADPLVPGEVLIAPSGLDLSVSRRGRVHLCPAPPDALHAPSVNTLFDSLATAYGGQAIGVLLTGMGRDGAEGLLAMRGAGAITVAQDADSSAVYGMPAAAAEIGAASYIVPLSRIGPLLNACARLCAQEGGGYPTLAEGVILAELEDPLS